jgi:hypothetical protein
MSSLARLVATLLALAVGACAFLPWTPNRSGMQIPLGTLLNPGDRDSASSWVASVGFVLLVGAGLTLLGVIANSRPFVIAGGLVTIAIPTTWILVNVISRNDGAVPVSLIQFGVYGAAIGGFMILILAAVAVDVRTPTVR